MIQKVDIESLRGEVDVNSVIVGTTATALPATAMRGRKVIVITNTSSNTIHIGDSAVTTGTGTPLVPSQGMAIDATDDIIWYGIAAGAGNDVRVMEIR